ncbi:MAG: hypothetical protein HQ541_06975 [Mariniphaga sp.]|nr:hypothetical protein [Mariniphaga sp.]
MLRKTSHIILSLLLLVSTMGLAISKHYCGGEVISVALFDEPESCCNMAGCCHNETSFYQVNEDYSLASISEIPVSAEFDLFGFAMLIDQLDEELISDRQDFEIAKSPPPVKIQISLSKRQAFLL